MIKDIISALIVLTAYNLYKDISLWAMLRSAVVDVMSVTTYIVMGSILSKIVPHAELGQGSAIMAVIEIIVPVVYKPLYSAIYRATLTTFPETFYVICSIMLTPATFVYWWMYHINNQEDKKTGTVEEIKSNDNLSFENN
ncbi:uncharacterized protein LOC132938919 [Metopolophium dirhodum]|uniref:uncharacterized protein LOC132938919 n=1 Tax=Metopolophium dirhodum TaxID=44670 RepID=UPI00298FD8DD|nr:uncharacterized protein LOC132938919 [Metopolophium dirhodum]